MKTSTLFLLPSLLHPLAMLGEVTVRIIRNVRSRIAHPKITEANFRDRHGTDHRFLPVLSLNQDNADPGAVGIPAPGEVQRGAKGGAIPGVGILHPALMGMIAFWVTSSVALSSNSVPEIYSVLVTKEGEDLESGDFRLDESWWFEVRIDHELLQGWHEYDPADVGDGVLYRTKYCWAGLYNDADGKHPAWIDARLIRDSSEYHNDRPEWTISPDDADEPRYYYTVDAPSFGYEYYVVKMVNRKYPKQWVEVWLWVDGSRESWQGFVLDSDGRFYIIDVDAMSEMDND